MLETKLEVTIEMLEGFLKEYETGYTSYMNEAKKYKPFTAEHETANQMAVWYDGKIQATKMALGLLKN